MQTMWTFHLLARSVSIGLLSARRRIAAYIGWEMKIDKNAIRFYGTTGAQINAQWYLLNPFISPRRAAWRRIRNFFHALRNGIALERK